MIKIENLNKSFARLEVLKNVNLQFNAGEVVCLVGPNGSGKTTLIKCLLGLVIPDSGSIHVKNENVIGTWAYRKDFGYMPQISRFPEQMKVRQIFQMMKDLRQLDSSLDEDLLQSFSLKDIMEKRMGFLSGGTRQKVSAALAYLFNPQILILDEPTAGLDPISSERLKAKVHQEKNNGKLTLITSHNMSEVEELADKVIFIVDGEIQFNKSVAAIKEEANESRLGKALAVMMEGFVHA
jgi:Cu-processing system ATP-binding protein